MSKYRRKKRKARSTKSIAKKALAEVNKLKRAVEWKHLDLSQSGNIGTTCTFTFLTDIDQGDTKNTRDGDEAIIRSVYIKGYSAMNASASGSALRIMLVLDKQSDSFSADITQSEILDVTIGAAVNAFRELDQKHRVVILHDEIITLDDSGGAFKTFKIFKKLNLKALYNDTTATLGRVSNHLYFVAVSNEATNTPYLAAQHRVRFTDS